MLIPVRCFTCGKVLADKYAAYAARCKELQATKPVDSVLDAPGLAFFDAQRTGPVLDELGLDRYCCRRHMIAHVEMVR
jgi:DNA-directed RNA polymerase subunit N (RpoN/RPB10)